MLNSIKGGLKYIYRTFRRILVDIILFGIFWAIMIQILSYIDNAIIYNPKLQSTRSIKRKIKKGLIEKQKHCAILISGEGAVISRILGSKGNLQEAYDALKKRGYKDTEIIILSSTIPEGRNPRVGITTRAKPKNLCLILDYLIGNIEKDYSITFYFTGNGRIKKGKSVILLGNKSFSQEELYNYFKLFKGRKILIFDQDYSGGFANKLGKLPKIIIMASTKRNKLSVNVPSVERLFWRKIGNRENVKKAYKQSVKDIGMGHKLIINAIEILSIGGAKNYYLVYGKGNIDIPRPRK